MRLWHHTLAAVPLTAVVLEVSGSGACAAAACFLSIFMDLDHIPDYLNYRRGWYGLQDFFTTCHETRIRRLFLVLHAWEWPLLCGIACWFGLGREWMAACAMGVAYHLMLDQFGNSMPPLFYWITHRARHGFDLARMTGS
jgi:hypothetical protein